jgi:hypothetical protein
VKSALSMQRVMMLLNKLKLRAQSPIADNKYTLLLYMSAFTAFHSARWRIADCKMCVLRPR